MPVLESLESLRDILKDVQRTLETTAARVRDDAEIPEADRDGMADLFAVERCVRIEYLGKSRDEGETIRLRPAEFLSYDAPGYYRITCAMPRDDGEPGDPEVWNGKHIRGDDDSADYKDRNTSTPLENAKAHAVSLETVSAQLQRGEHTNRRLTLQVEALAAEKLAWTAEKGELLAIIGNLENQCEQLRQQTGNEEIRWEKLEGGLFDTLRGVAEGMGWVPPRPGGAPAPAPAGDQQQAKAPERTAYDKAADDLVNHVRRNTKAYNYLLRNGARGILLRLPPPPDPENKAPEA